MSGVCMGVYGVCMGCVWGVYGVCMVLEEGGGGRRSRRDREEGRGEGCGRVAEGGG